MKFGLLQRQFKSSAKQVPISALAMQGWAQSGYCLAKRRAAEVEAMTPEKAMRMVAKRIVMGC